MAMVRAYFFVGTSSTTLNVSAESSWTTVRVPDPPFELNASCISGSNPAASGSSPILSINFEQLGLVLDVHEDVPVARADREFRLAAHGEHLNHASIHAIDCGDTGAAAVECKNALGSRVIENRVGILPTRADRADGFQGFQVENRNRVRAAVAHETASQVGSQRDSVHALRIRNIANNRVGIRIQNDDVRGMRYIHASGVAIDDAIIPPSVSADGNGLHHLIARRAWNNRVHAQKSGKENCSCEKRPAYDCQNVFATHG